MWDLIPRKLMPPTRVARYCCAVLKEQNGKGRFLATGVRWAESVSRSKRRGIFEKQVSNRDKEVHIRNDEESLDALFAPCKLAAKRFVNPIVDWSDREVWDFLHDARIPVNICVQIIGIFEQVHLLHAISSQIFFLSAL